ncbi:hypothetical protein [Actinophytocola oryzae]|uniref:Uncharacterized protein n=1 Tax=Actinophytocola oryzae TaxID=502181 RepID=A0A4R7V3E2_9PSEU|nr:hypothetical protein [Actinophytocola oryzae]TDV43117.1 hypothetical protein CLV71_11651 [Actinophytocola oryzae]
MAIDWCDGQVVTLLPGDTAELGELDHAQLYGVFLYNTAVDGTSTEVTITWSRTPGNEPVTVTVPGTPGGQGPAVIRFVSGRDADHITATITQGRPTARITAFIGGVRMPVDGGGLNDAPLPDNGRPQAFLRLTRFYCRPAARRYWTRVKADVDEFVAVRFAEDFAHVTVVNTTRDPADRIQGIGAAATMFLIDSTTGRSHQSRFDGDGGRQVWVNADCVQYAQNATVALRTG